ncbi:uroporphyrinogen-III C-methyltransferase [Candidatus Roizmanbacteria bacterium]|jgi:uroporphyrin-III C-methyltransferase|nr:uroporphyrinogen-III C-methyltransferase [Candidatus Roizmanbacteria bacterium]
MNEPIQLYPVSIVGTGPGDPDFLTVKASRVIREADIILYDCQPAKLVLNSLPTSATVIYVSRHPQEGDENSYPGKSLLDLVQENYLNGKKVVRLKVGDPMLFGGELNDHVALSQMNIPFEVIPGISAGVGAASAYALSISAKYESDSVTHLIAHEIRDNFALIRDAARLLLHGSTIVLYMADEHLEAIFNVFSEEGIPEDMPVVAVCMVGWPEEFYVSSTMKCMGKGLANNALKKPIVYFVGKYVSIGNIVKDHARPVMELVKQPC